MRLVCSGPECSPKHLLRGHRGWYRDLFEQACVPAAVLQLSSESVVTAGKYVFTAGEYDLMTIY